MIRRDYIVRMIEEMGRALARIRALRAGGDSAAAAELVDEECHKLTTLGVAGIMVLSETELLVRVAEGEFAQTIHLRTLLVISLLREAADIAAAAGREEEARAIYLKALHLLLGVLAQVEAVEFPDFVPNVDLLVLALQGRVLPPPTLAMLMRHYEALGQYGKAEDTLYSILNQVPIDDDSLKFAREFYQRLLRRSEAALAAGNLPRHEAEQGLAELEKMKKP